MSQTTEPTERQIAILRAVVDRIFPNHDDIPGGLACGVDAYILAQITRGDLTARLPEYVAGLDILDGTRFLDRDDAGRDALLTERAETPFFRMLVEHAHEGYWTSPKTWPAIGFDVTG